VCCSGTRSARDLAGAGLASRGNCQPANVVRCPSRYAHDGSRSKMPQLPHDLHHQASARGPQKPTSSKTRNRSPAATCHARSRERHQPRSTDPQSEHLVRAKRLHVVSIPDPLHRCACRRRRRSAAVLCRQSPRLVAGRLALPGIDRNGLPSEARCQGGRRPPVGTRSALDSERGHAT